MWASLLHQLLDPDSATRMTAKEAHRFVKAHQNGEDDEQNIFFSADEADMTSAVTAMKMLPDGALGDFSDSSCAGIDCDHDEQNAPGRPGNSRLCQMLPRLLGMNSRS